jgi:hypothetical protein
MKINQELSEKESNDILILGMLHLLEPSEGIIVEYNEKYYIIHLSIDSKIFSIHEFNESYLTNKNDKIKSGTKIIIFNKEDIN